MISLAFPAAVCFQERTWHATPLLVPAGPWTGLGSNPVLAVESLERAVAKGYRVVYPHQNHAIANLGWEPADLTTPRVVIPLGGGRRMADRTALVGTFTCAGSRYVVVPRLSRWFVVEDGPDWEGALSRAVTLWRRQEDEEDAEPPTPSDLSSDRVLPARIRLYPQVQPPALGGAAGGGFALLFKPATFNGPQAIAAIATELDRPRRAAIAGARSEEITSALTADPPIPIAVVGPAGSGRKTLVLDAIASSYDAVDDDWRARWELRLDSGRVEHLPKGPTAPRVYHLDPQRIVTGMSIVGEWQRRLESALRWVSERRRHEDAEGGGDLLFVDDPVGLARVGRSAGSDMVASVLLRAWIERGAFPMAIVATPEQWSRLVELDRPFAELFRTIRVQEPAPAHVARVVNAARTQLEGARRVFFAASAIRRIYDLDAAYPSDQVRPGSIVAHLAKVADQATGRVLAEQVEAAFAHDSGLRPEIVSDERLEDGPLRERIAAALVEQPAAVDVLAGAVHAVKSGLRPRGRPIATWLFVGPTGVGKTEAAKVLTRTLFTTDHALLRFDLNAYADPGAVHRLLGGPDAEGALTTAVRRRPVAVVLLDEVEKAHPAVHDLLLQLLDEGRLTDGDGRATSFETTIVVMTSNVGASDAASGVGFGRDAEDLAQVYRSAVGRAFRPELVNRIDRIVPFGTLSPRALRAVAELQLQLLLARDGFRNRTVLFDVSADALDHVATDAWDPRFGARGLKRALERRVVAGAAATLAGSKGDEPIRVSVRLETDQRVAFTATALTWAEPAPPLADLPDPAGAAATLSDQVASRRPPEGFVIRSPRPSDEPDYGEILALAEDLAELAERAQQEDEPPLAERSLIHAGAGRTGAVSPISRYGYRSPRRDPRVLASRAHGGLRAALLDLVAPTGATSTREALVEDLRIARVRLAGLDGPGTLGVSLVSETRPTEGWNALSAAFWGGWEALARRVGGEWQGTGDQRIAHGGGLCALIGAEVGLHWWLPPDGAPIAAALRIDAAGEEQSHAIIVRTYAPPASTKDPGAIHDLRSDAIVPFREFTAALTGWALRAHGGRS